MDHLQRYQWDLNFTNPEVFLEIVELMFFLANLGVDVLRLDAAPFLWKRMGTNCQNQPEVFQLIQAFRAIMRIVAPGVIFKAEAIVPPDALVRYLGVRSTVEKQCELAYNNQRMVLLWSALATGRVNLFTQVMHRAPQLLIGCAPINYLRNHDDIGWAMSDEDLQAVGETPHLHRRFLNEFYSGASRDPSPAATCSATIPAPAMPASPAPPPPWRAWSWPWSRATRPRSTGPLARILLLHGLILGAGGIPVLHMGDELGLLNDRQLPAGSPQGGRQPLAQPAAHGLGESRSGATTAAPWKGGSSRGWCHQIRTRRQHLPAARLRPAAADVERQRPCAGLRAQAARGHSAGVRQLQRRRPGHRRPDDPLGGA